MQHQTAGPAVIDEHTQAWGMSKALALLAAWLGTFPLAEIHLVVSICTGIVVGALAAVNLAEKLGKRFGGKRR